jgi:hypothetical protein
MAKSLETLLVKAQRRNWQKFWTGDESWIRWENFHCILVTTRPGDASENSTDDRREQIDTGRSFSLAGCLIIDAMPKILHLLRSTS